MAKQLYRCDSVVISSFVRTGYTTRRWGWLLGRIGFSITHHYPFYPYKTNTQIAKELKITQILDKLLECKRSWIQHVNRMPRNRLPRVMKYYSPAGRRNYGRRLKRFLDTWDRNGSTSGPTPWKICDDDDDDAGELTNQQSGIHAVSGYFWCSFPKWNWQILSSFGCFVTCAFCKELPVSVSCVHLLSVWQTCHLQSDTMSMPINIQFISTCDSGRNSASCCNIQPPFLLLREKPKK